VSGGKLGLVVFIPWAKHAAVIQPLANKTRTIPAPRVFLTNHLQALFAPGFPRSPNAAHVALLK